MRGGIKLEVLVRNLLEYWIFFWVLEENLRKNEVFNTFPLSKQIFLPNQL